MRACAMEVSSHALALERSDGIRFAVAVFTNLTQDHLDFHADMEDYFLAKRRLFAGAAGRRSSGAVNRDDRYGRGSPPRLGVARPSPTRARGADFRAGT